MNTKRISLGILAWFLGIIVPVMHHTLLHWPLAGLQTNNIITRSKSLFKSLPWIDWIYLAAMAIVGVMLIISGIKSDENKG
jgi:hypothetical protein